jgi:hypothetical protein
VAANLVNPYGLTLLRFPFALTGSAFMEQIYEWLPPYSEAYRNTYMARYYLLWAFVGAIACALGLRLWWRRRLAAGLFPVFVYAVFLVLSLRMNRAVTDFALATLPGVAALLTAALLTSEAPVASEAPAGAARRGDAKRLPEASRFAFLGVVFMALAATFAIIGYRYAPGSGRRIGWGLGPGIPVRAADFVRSEGLEGNCFNDYASGAWLVYRFHPRVRVAMDSRNDVYGEALYAEYQRALADPPALASLLRRIDATFLFLQWAAPGASGAARTIADLDDGWRPVMFDDLAVVYVKQDGPYASLWSGRAYRVLDPGTFRPGMWDPTQAAVALLDCARDADRSTHGCRPAGRGPRRRGAARLRGPTAGAHPSPPRPRPPAARREARSAGAAAARARAQPALHARGRGARAGLTAPLTGVHAASSTKPASARAFAGERGTPARSRIRGPRREAANPSLPPRPGPGILPAPPWGESLPR